MYRHFPGVLEAKIRESRASTPQNKPSKIFWLRRIWFSDRNFWRGTNCHRTKHCILGMAPLPGFQKWLDKDAIRVDIQNPANQLVYGKYLIKYVKTMSVGVCKFMFFPCFCVGHHQNHPETSCISPLILPMFEAISPWKEVLGTGPAVRNEYSSRFDKKVFNSIHRYICDSKWPFDSPVGGHLTI